MKNLIIFSVLAFFVMFTGTISLVEAHPHATIDLTNSHSHVLLDEKYHDNFILHTFDKVIISAIEFVNSLF